MPSKIRCEECRSMNDYAAVLSRGGRCLSCGNQILDKRDSEPKVTREFKTSALDSFRPFTTPVKEEFLELEILDEPIQDCEHCPECRIMGLDSCVVCLKQFDMVV